jgi:hypothetical protein
MLSLTILIGFIIFLFKPLGKVLLGGVLILFAEVGIFLLLIVSLLGGVK